VARGKGGSPEIDELLGVLKERVDQRRAAGMYPPELEEELDAHFRRISAHRVDPNIDDVRRALDKLEGSINFAMERIDVSSNLPGGDKLHRALAKAQARQVGGVLSQVHEFARRVQESLEALADAVESPTSHVHPDLVGQLDAVLERVAAYERQPADTTGAVADLRLRVERLEQAESDRAFRPWFENSHFEDSFRGTAEELRERYRDMAHSLAGFGPVVDIGCGRGEFLELLRKEGIEATGVELEPHLVADTRSKGLNVELGDGLEYLRRCDDASLGAIVLIQVIEHLQQQGVTDLVLLARDKLKPGGRIICETVNPLSLYVYARSFYLDPTHIRPVHPAYLSFLFTEAGFSGITIDWRSEVPSDERLEVPDGDGADARNAARLNNLLFGMQDYAIVATR
jgi:O-antigen chain-terminating methyltransferase